MDSKPIYETNGIQGVSTIDAELCKQVVGVTVVPIEIGRSCIQFFCSEQSRARWKSNLLNSRSMTGVQAVEVFCFPRHIFSTFSRPPIQFRWHDYQVIPMKNPAKGPARLTEMMKPICFA